MPLPSPKLDDRSFEDLVREAQTLIRSRCPVWTDLSPGDPGMTLVEVLAFLTDAMLYRLNRIPEKVYVALLDLLGASILPPSAARVLLTITRAGDADTAIAIPAGTRVSDPSGAVIFTTIEDASLQKGATGVAVPAVHADLIEAELVGVGTGAAAQSFRVRKPPIIRDLGDTWTVMVGVEIDSPDGGGEAAVRSHGGKVFAIWQEVTSFMGLDTNSRPYTFNRADGLITFAPPRGVGETGSPTLAAVPPKGREVRVWYRRGGGREGNVAAGSLTVFKEPLSDVNVTNLTRASGGENGETVEQALLRGREAVRVLSSAVTARDFERVAREAGGVARARAYAQRDIWAFGEPGVVEIRIVPKIDRSSAVDGAVTPELLAAHQTPELTERIEALLADRRPLGVKTRVLWAGCRPVSISARVVVSRTEDPALVKTRLNARLNDLVAPDKNWEFGKTLRASDAYEAILAERGVRYTEQLRFAIKDAPHGRTVDVVRDRRQLRSYFTAGDDGVFRSLDNGRSWTRVLAPPGERPAFVRCHDETPGLAVAVTSTEAGAWPVYLSSDGGESWVVLERIQDEQVYDVAWGKRGERPLLLLATRKGLRRFELGSEGGSKTVDNLGPGIPQDVDGFYAVTTGRHPLGVSMVAAAAREKQGVLLSLQGGEAGTFVPVPGAQGRDVRVLTFQIEGGRSFLWAGIAAEGGAEGEGAMRIEARATGIDPGGWVKMSGGWQGGSCESLDFAGPIAVAGSNRSGVLTLNSTTATPAWTASPLDSGLPINADRRALVPVAAVAAGALDGGGDGILILAGTRAGTFISLDGGRKFNEAGQIVFAEHAPLPANWLYCSGEHDLTVVPEDEDVRS
jgi:baseplate J-like protein